MAKVPIVPQTGLIFRETFRNVGDVIENGGTINGGVVNNGYLSDASGQNIKYQTQFNGQSLTIAAKIDLTFISGTFQTLFAIRNISGTYFEVGIDGTASTSDKKMYFFDGTIRYSTTTIPSTTKHIAYTKDSSHNIIFYADGVKVGSTVAGVALTNPLPNFYIGATYSGTQSMRGTAEEFYFYDRDLSAEEVLDLYEEDTFQEVDDSKFLLSLPLRSNYNDGSNQVTENIGSLGGTVTLGDGTTSTTFPTQLTPKGMSFDGTTDYLSAIDGQIDLDALRITGDITFGLMMRLADDVAADYAGGIGVTAAAETEATNALYLMSLKTTNIISYIHEYGAGNNEAYDFAYVLSPGSLYHVYLVRDNSLKTVTLYINGDVQGVFTYTNSPTGGSETVFDIGRNIAFNKFFNGNFYLPRVGSFAATPTQIKGLYEKDRRLLNI